MARTKPFIRTRYYATGPIVVNGTAYRDGDEILNARPCNIEAMLRRGQVTAKDWEEPKPGKAPPPEPEPDAPDAKPEVIAARIEPAKPKPADKPLAEPKIKPKTKSLSEE